MESEVGHSIGRYDRHFNPRMSRTKFNFILWGAHYIPEMLPTQPQKPKSGGHPSIQHTPLSILLIASLISHVYSSNFILFMLVSFALTSFGKLPLVPYLFSQFCALSFPTCILSASQTSKSLICFKCSGGWWISSFIFFFGYFLFNFWQFMQRFNIPWAYPLLTTPFITLPRL